MNARRMAKIASTLICHADKIVSSSCTHDEFDAQAYWDASEGRFRRWNRALQLFSSDIKEEGNHQPWPALKIVVEEILFSEMLTRVWTAIISLGARDQVDREQDAILRAAWIGHLGARRQALKLIIMGQSHDSVVAEELDLLRRRLERWTDILLSRLDQLGDLSQFVFDAARFEEWARDFRDSSEDRSRKQWDLLRQSLEQTLDEDDSSQSANPDLNLSIAQVITACIPVGESKRDTAPASTWMTRLTHKTNEMQSLIDEYISHAG